MKLPKSSHTGDPLAAVLILYLGRAIRPPKIPGNPNGTYNMPKQYSRSINNEGTSKKLSCMVRTSSSRAVSLFCPSQDRVVQTFVFSSRPSCVVICHPRPTPLLPARDLSTANDSIESFLPPSLVDNETSFTLPSSNNPPLSPSWKDSRHMKKMNPFKASFAFFIICLRPRFI